MSETRPKEYAEYSAMWWCVCEHPERPITDLPNFGDVECPRCQIVIIAMAHVDPDSPCTIDRSDIRERLGIDYHTTYGEVYEALCRTGMLAALAVRKVSA